MELVSDLLAGLFMLLSFALWLLPIAFAVWVLQRLSTMSREVRVLRRQLVALAEHSGAPIVTPPPVTRRDHLPLWAFGIVLALFLIVFGGIYTVGSSTTTVFGGDAEPVEEPPAR